MYCILTCLDLLGTIPAQPIVPLCVHKIGYACYANPLQRWRRSCKGGGQDFVLREGSRVYFMITRYLHSPSECLCDDNTLQCFSVPFIG